MRAAPIILMAACLAASACQRDAVMSPSSGAASAELTPVPASTDWPASTPEAENLDRARLADLVLRIRRGDYGRIGSVLVARHGRLAVEEYFKG